MKKILFICFCFSVFVDILVCSKSVAADWSNNKPLDISKQVYNNKKLPFIPHVGKGRFDNYLAMTINYDAIKPLFLQLEKRLGKKLKNRGEAHITVVTPVEYHQILKPFLSMEAINHLAKDIQRMSFSVICVGAFETQIKHQNEQTYYVVVKSDDFMLVRQRILKAFVDAGANEKDFKVNAFYPHITVGFSARDLHLSDGAKKGDGSCAYPLNVQ